MYGHPKHMLDEAEALTALSAFSRLALLITSAGGLRATHLPLAHEATPAPFGRFLGHIARANPHWRDMEAGNVEALIVLLGAETYVSPTWYETKKRDARAVPTWNYETLHVRGRASLYSDADRLRANVAALSDRHEAGRAEPWNLTEAPADYVERLLSAIVGVEIVIDGVEGKRKLSQEKPPEDRAGVIAALEASGDPHDSLVAKAMRDIERK